MILPPHPTGALVVIVVIATRGRNLATLVVAGPVHALTLGERGGTATAAARVTLPHPLLPMMMVFPAEVTDEGDDQLALKTVSATATEIIQETAAEEVESETAVGEPARDLINIAGMMTLFEEKLLMKIANDDVAVDEKARGVTAIAMPSTAMTTTMVRGRGRRANMHGLCDWRRRLAMQLIGAGAR